METPTERGEGSAVRNNEHSAPSTSEAGDAPQYLPPEISFTGLRRRNALLYETGPIAPPTRHYDEFEFILEGMRFPERLYGPLYFDVYDDWSDSTSWHYSSSDSEGGDSDDNDNAGQHPKPEAEEFMPAGGHHNFYGQAYQQPAGAQQLGGHYPVQHAAQALPLVHHQPVYQLPAFDAAFPHQDYGVHGWAFGHIHQHQQGPIQPPPGMGFGQQHNMPHPLPLPLLEAPAENQDQDALQVAGPSRPNNYQGDATNPRNMSADITDAENCSFFITGLPSDLTLTELLGYLRNTGKIFQVCLNPPTGEHGTTAGKLIFFHQEDAQRFYQQTRRSGFKVRDVVAQVKRNRIRVAEQEHPYSTYSRVVVVRGPRALVDMETSIRPLLDEHIRLYDVETHWMERVGRNEAELTICFGSCRAQAHAAWLIIGRELNRRGVSVAFGRDPCEP